ncbi:MAG: prepilin-type N-terminal cleavage/methylation domain-containing protein [Gammaproteobacteria bacterium]|nr:prepilin-type N-terminal cleavage/methylation domain-containing protein [Gammaproteobacteria bacterium]MBU1645894.1 prepilin-type N-terminal cleavage/methylation domain-containing protein [Gammaproteobacteria bacterium]MBU1971956.1 prepilin-type N-terminal cleavage/methylation domain-containing protein [Gammaproteobacteria bacterium]
MSSIGRRGCAGFSILELVVAVAIIAVLAAALLQSLRFVQRGAEKQAFNDARSVIEGAVRHEALRRIADGQAGNAAALQGSDPFQWMNPKLPGWAGAYPVGGKAAPGAWYWHGSAAQVVYFPKNPDHVDFHDAGAREIRLRLEVTADGSGARLLPVTRFAWR